MPLTDSTQATHPSQANQISMASSNSKTKPEIQPLAQLLSKMIMETASSTQTSSHNCSRYSNSSRNQTSVHRAPILKLMAIPASKMGQILEMVAWEVKRITPGSLLPVSNR